MQAQILLNVNAQKHLVAKALCRYVDFSKRVYIAYGSTNHYLLHHLGIEIQKAYMAGCNTNGKFNITLTRDKPVILKNYKPVDIKDFEITSKDVFIKGANALWYENGKKHSAVCAADPNGGTYGNFYIKAVNRGSRVIIPVTHEKLIPYFVPASQDADFATGSKIAMLRLFAGEVFTEIEAFKLLFGLEAEVICAGGIGDSKGAVGFLVRGADVKKALEFAEEYNAYEILPPWECAF